MYSYQVPETKKEHYAIARAEDLEGSYKDLSQVCARIRNKSIKHAIELLQKAANMEIPIFYSTFNKNLGHRRELGGRKGRYPQKAVKLVLKVLNSAIANGKVKGLNEDMVIVHASANKKFTYPRMASKGRRFRQNYATSRVEIIVKEKIETKKEKKKKQSIKVDEKKPEITSEPKHEDITDKAHTKKEESKKDTHTHKDDHKDVHKHSEFNEKKTAKTKSKGEV